MYYTKYLHCWCCFSVIKSCPTLCDQMDCNMPGSSVLHYLLALAQIHVHCVGDAIQPSHPLPAATSLSILPSIRVFSNAMTFCIRRPKYWSFSLRNGPSNEYSGLISFRIDWFNLHAVQGTLKSLLQHHNWKATILWHSAFFMIQLSHPYLTTGKNSSFWLYRAFFAKYITAF